MSQGFNLHDYLLNNLPKQVETPDGYIRLSGPLERDNIVNGDGLRAILWTQGCPNHCKGCQNPETWDYGAGQLVKIDLCHLRRRSGRGMRRCSILFRYRLPQKSCRGRDRFC